jgi:hypothetical protein
MTYALVRNDIIEQVGPPRLWFDGLRWWDFRNATESYYNEAGWQLVVETTRPDDTATHTSDRTVELINDVPTVVWVVRPLSVDELSNNQQTLNRSTLETRAGNALTANNNFIAIASPTNAQAAAYLKTVAKELNAIIRLILNQVDDIGDTE